MSNEAESNIVDDFAEEIAETVDDLGAEVAEWVDARWMGLLAEIR